MLYYIKKILGYGKVSVCHRKENIAEFRIRDQKVIIQIILPIFDKYPLLTRKQFTYDQFRKALLIYNNKKLRICERNSQLFKLKILIKPENYISKSFNPIINDKNSYDDTIFINKQTSIEKIISKIVSKEFVIGFTEAKGNFYLVKKGPTRIRHMFEVSKKDCKIVLQCIALILDIKVYEKNTYYTIITQNQKSVYRVIEFFNGQIKGIKAVEFQI